MATTEADNTTQVPNTADPGDTPSPGSRLSITCRDLALQHPLLPPALSLAAGILLDRYLPMPLWTYTLIFLTAGALLAWSWRSSRHRGLLAILSIALAAASLGALRHQSTFWRIPPDHLLPRLPEQGSLARLRGTIVTEPLCPQVEHSQYSLPTRGHRPTTFVLQAEQVETPTGWTPCDSLIRVRIAETAAALQVGDRVETPIRLRRLLPPGNPGEFDWQLYQRRTGIYLTGSVDEQEAVRVLQPASWSTGSLSGLLTRFRQISRGVLLDNIAPDGPEAGLLADYIAGHRWSVSKQIDEAFRLSGTAHILSVSGSHVVMIGAFGMMVGMLLLHRPQRAAMAGLAAVLFFGLIVEPNAPALRAVIAAILASTAILMRRPFNGLNWLAASFLILLLVSPTDIFNAGFQLSFFAVAALFVVCPTMERWLFGRRTLSAVIRTRVQYDIQSRLRISTTRWLSATCCTGLTAWLASAPLIAWHYGSLYTYGVISTFLILPVATVVLALGFLKLIIGFLWPSAGALLAPATTWSAHAMSSLAIWSSSWPSTCIPVTPPPLWLTATYFTLLTLWAWHDHRQQRAIAALLDSTDDSPAEIFDKIPPQPKIRAKLEAHILRQIRPLPTWLILLTAAALGATYYVTTRPPAPPTHPRIHVLAVGDGLAVLVRSPNGRVLLYDCGSISNPRLAETTILPALRHLDIHQIDTVVLSHPNLDHYSGLVDLARAMPINEVWLTESFLATPGLPKQMIRDLTQLHIPLHPIAQGQTITGLGPLAVQAIWPPTGFTRPSQSDNDASTVLQINYQGRRILLTGDAGPYAQQQLMTTAAKDIRSDVLLLPHHGHPATLHPHFVEAVQPRIAIASIADTNKWKRPALTADSACLALDTQTSGMITIDLSPTELETIEFRHHE